MSTVTNDIFTDDHKFLRDNQKDISMVSDRSNDLRDVSHVDDVKQSMQILANQEACNYRPCIDYIKLPPSFVSCCNAAERVSEVWRQKVCEWCFQVVEYYNFNRDVVFIAINYLDRMVSIQTMKSKASIRKLDFKLIAVTSLYLAIKLHGDQITEEGIRRKLKINSFYELSERRFSICEIEAMEWKMISALSWYLNPPTPSAYISRFVLLCPRWTSNGSSTSYDATIRSIRDTALYLSELTVSDSRFTFSASPLLVSYTSVLFTVRSLKVGTKLPVEVKTSLLDNLSQCVDIFPEDNDVVKVLTMLNDICPEPTSTDENNDYDHSRDIDSDGKSSPVCVSDGCIHDKVYRRKRIRGNCP